MCAFKIVHTVVQLLCLFMATESFAKLEVTFVMGYSRPRSQARQPSVQPSFDLIDRRPKRFSKSQWAKANKPAKSPKVGTYRKHLYVFDYMGKDAPKSFASSDRKIVVSGLLEPITVCAFEHKVREEILAVIHEADVFGMNVSACASNDFEFIQVSAKAASVPTVREGFSWTGDAVMSLPGQGAVYIRLLKDFTVIPVHESDSDPADIEVDSVSTYAVLPFQLCGRLLMQNLMKPPLPKIHIDAYYSFDTKFFPSITS